MHIEPVYVHWYSILIFFSFQYLGCHKFLGSIWVYIPNTASAKFACFSDVSSLLVVVDGCVSAIDKLNLLCTCIVVELDIQEVSNRFVISLLFKLLGKNSLENLVNEVLIHKHELAEYSHLC